MRRLELLAPARNKDIGIAAIDCGADAVYIGAEEFGARKDAGNSMEDIAELCSYAHRFGVRIFLTVNNLLRDDELESAHATMLRARDAGVDAFIIRDMRLAGLKDVGLPVHASTQCAIHSVEDALRYQEAGCSRVILERELSLEQIHQICTAVSCDVECFVHGALCVGYSGQCRLSEYLDGRSADRGECIQACRSLYDLVDEDGKVLVKDKALLSLKDFRLRDRLADLVQAGAVSFKIEGRLKNLSYVANVVKDYSMALDDLVASHPDKYCRESYGTVTGGFSPDTDKTFNRGYTQLYLDGRRERGWSSMDAPKWVGEEVGKISRLKPLGGDMTEISLALKPGLTPLSNGDGFAFITKSGAVRGFRGEACLGSRIRCRGVESLREGLTLYRNIDSVFEKNLAHNMPQRLISVHVDVSIEDGYRISAAAQSEDGRTASISVDAGAVQANDVSRTLSMLRSGLAKKSQHYSFEPGDINVATAGGTLPLLSASAINGIRRSLAEAIDSQPCARVTEKNPARQSRAGETQYDTQKTLLRSKYCIRYELGMCPVHQGARNTGKLYLLNNGRRLALGFDCGSCEMTLTATQN